MCVAVDWGAPLIKLLRGFSPRNVRISLEISSSHSDSGGKQTIGALRSSEAPACVVDFGGCSRRLNQT